MAGPVTAPTAATVSSPHGVRVIRAVAAIPGWTATWQPARGATARLAISRAGAVQAVDVPAGRGVLTWSYAPPGFAAGLTLSLAAFALILLLVIACWTPVFGRAAACVVPGRRKGYQRC
jgi:hypothetical protein